MPNLYGLVQGEANAIAPGDPAVVDVADDRAAGRQVIVLPRR